MSTSSSCSRCFFRLYLEAKNNKNMYLLCFDRADNIMQTHTFLLPPILKVASHSQLSRQLWSPSTEAHTMAACTADPSESHAAWLTLTSRLATSPLSHTDWACMMDYTMDYDGLKNWHSREKHTNAHWLCCVSRLWFSVLRFTAGWNLFSHFFVD